MDPNEFIAKIALAARSAAGVLAASSGQCRNDALGACADALRASNKSLRAANAKDLALAKGLALSPAMTDRLRLSDSRIESMAAALEQIAAQTDPVGQAISASNRPNGLRVEKRRVPIGVVGIIYESRPNVTADAAGLCLKSGNACILRGGKESLHSNLAIARALHAGLRKANLPPGCVTVIDSTDHALVTAMARAQGLIDLIIPRGGEQLIRAVVQAATVPVIKHYTGNCHVYVHAQADLAMAERIVLNAKCQRPGVCNATETLLIDQAVAKAFGATIVRALLGAKVECRLSARAKKLLPPALRSRVKDAVEADWACEYNDLILAVDVVDDLDQAVRHINTYGSKHTDAIVTGSLEAAEAFVTAVDSSSVMVNASTRFSDGGEYGLGAEIGISTDKLHARGPMGAEDLTTYKWVVTGNGHVRT